MLNRTWIVIVIVCVSLWTIARAEVKIVPELPSAFINTSNALCNQHSQLFLQNLNNLTLWAYEMWESSAHGAVGALSGNTFQLGHYDECLNAESPFRTQYCLAEIQIHIQHVNRDKFSPKYNPNESALNKFYFTGDRFRIPRNIINMGICIPASCTERNIQEALTSHFEQINGNHSLNLTYSAKVLPQSCHTNGANEGFGAGDISFCLIMIIIVLAVIICTAYDLWETKKITAKKSKKELPERLCLCFSAVRNFNDLSRKDDSNDALNVLYGMRTFAILMIIIDHRCGTFISSVVLNRNFVEAHYRSFASLFIFHGDLFVDSFFVLSGLLVTYSLLVSFEKRITPPLLIVFNRYVRLTPIFAVVIFFYATLLYKTGAGPLWNIIIGNMQADCQENWWASLLYISNYVNDDRICMVHTWYLPCDFHYFILAIPTILLLRKRPQTGLAVMLGAFIIALIIPFALTIYYRRPALLYFTTEFLSAPKIHPDFRLTYTKSHTRAAAYIIGMFTGYVYYKLRGSTFRLSLMKSTGLILLGLVLMFAGMTSGGIFYNPYHEYNAFEAAVYAGLHRPAWALGSAILLLTASYGRFGVMKIFLEWQPWVPLSKLVYGAYLVHMCWQLRYAALVKSPMYLDEISIITMGLGDIGVSFSLALVLYLLIEAPSRKVFRELMNPRRRKVEEKREIPLREHMTENGIEGPRENSRL